ncbi:MAG: hypothetical protein CL879_00410, partial [Dehalococcoidia bacterium]|nr:hypothetical protein [Dehalococcoidia bacterium]
LTCANQALSIKSNDTSGLALKTAALIGLNKLDDWGFLCDLDRLIETQVISVPAGYNDLRTFNDALLRRCAEDKSQIFEPRHKAIRMGQRIDFLHMDPTPGPVSSLLEFVNKAAKRYCDKNLIDPKHPCLAQSPSNWKILAWGSILSRQGHHVPHMHSDGWLSGVYYGKLPEVMRTENTKQEGCIEFGRPENYIDNQNGPDFRVVYPQEGTMILFPSYFYHRTIPFNADDTRFTVSFDIVPLSW